MRYNYAPAPDVASPTRDDVQGWILNGYNMASVRHVVMTVVTARPVHAFIDAATAPQPAVTPIQPATRWATKPDRTLNLGITWTGLRALGVPDTTLDGFPADFRRGAARRASRVGDIFESSPSNWDPHIADTDAVHLLWTIHGSGPAALDAGQAELADELGAAVEVVAVYDGYKMDQGRVHFGYVDGIAQPRIAGFEKSPPAVDQQRPAPLGAFFAGHPCEYEEVIYDTPRPLTFAGNGTYNAFRILEQDVFGFDQYLREQGEAVARDPEWLAARICGRWRNGDPVEVFPDAPRAPDIDAAGNVIVRTDRNDFLYADNLGHRCPLGSHIRRANPRNTPIVQKSTNATRRVIRRGMSYGPEITPGQPRDDIPRGLVGNFFCASLTAQFESLMQDWINLGLHHPTITGTNDIMVGTNDPAVSEYLIPQADGPDITLRNFPSFVRTRASIYAFMPTLSGLRWLAGR